MLAEPLALPKYTRQRQAAVAVILDGLDLAQPHGHGQAALQAGIGLGLAGTGALRLGQCAGDDLLELADAGGIDLLRHAQSPMSVT